VGHQWVAGPVVGQHHPTWAGGVSPMGRCGTLVVGYRQHFRATGRESAAHWATSTVLASWELIVFLVDLDETRLAKVLGHQHS
jgi:hypothetical protein